MVHGRAPPLIDCLSTAPTGAQAHRAGKVATLASWLAANRAEWEGWASPPPAASPFFLCFIPSLSPPVFPLHSARLLCITQPPPPHAPPLVPHPCAHPASRSSQRAAPVAKPLGLRTHQPVRPSHNDCAPPTSCRLSGPRWPLPPLDSAHGMPAACQHLREDLPPLYPPAKPRQPAWYVANQAKCEGWAIPHQPSTVQQIAPHGFVSPHKKPLGS